MEPENPWPLFPEQKVAEPAAAPSYDKAGFWRRAAAFIMDLTLLQWLTLLFIWIGATAEDMALAQSISVGHDLSDSLIEWAAVNTRIGSLLFLIYFSFFAWYGGQTPGKMTLGIRVVTTDGVPISPLRAVARTLCYYLDFFTLCLGFLLAAVPPAKRALHDLVCGTVVVRVQPK